MFVLYISYRFGFQKIYTKAFLDNVCGLNILESKESRLEIVDSTLHDFKFIGCNLNIRNSILKNFFGDCATYLIYDRFTSKILKSYIEEPFDFFMYEEDDREIIPCEGEISKCTIDCIAIDHYDGDKLQLSDCTVDVLLLRNPKKIWKLLDNNTMKYLIVIFTYDEYMDIEEAIKLSFRQNKMKTFRKYIENKRYDKDRLCVVYFDEDGEMEVERYRNIEDILDLKNMIRDK